MPKFSTIWTRGQPAPATLAPGVYQLRVTGKLSAINAVSTWVNKSGYIGRKLRIEKIPGHDPIEFEFVDYSARALNADSGEALITVGIHSAWVIVVAVVVGISALAAAAIGISVVLSLQEVKKMMGHAGPLLTGSISVAVLLGMAVVVYFLIRERKTVGALAARAAAAGA